MSALTAPRADGFRIGGVLRGRLLIPGRDDMPILEGVGEVVGGYNRLSDRREYVFGGRHNAFVNQGLQRVLDSAFNGLTAARITHIGVSSDNTAVTASTTTLAGTTSIKATSGVARTNQTVSAEQTWTQADVNFSIRKIGLLTSSAAADVVNIIGGAGSSPYNEPFTIDLTTIATWSLTMGIDVTATAS
jgi:hypothetical protein